MVVQKIGAALKKMSQRAMWRGNRDQAELIHGHGMYGMRTSLKENEGAHHEVTGMLQNNHTGVSTTGGGAQHTNTTTAHSGSQTQTHANQNTQSQNSSTVGKNILDSLM